jgi:hypothetical protein
MMLQSIRRGFAACLVLVAWPALCDAQAPPARVAPPQIPAVAAATPADVARDVLAAERTVRDFNAALSARRLDTALALVARGAVNFNLRVAHGDPGAAAPPLTSDLAAHWSTVSPILFGQTRSFTREVRGLSTQLEGDLATTWAQIATVTQPRDGSAAVQMAFSEAYLLRREAAGWRIIAMASARAGR